MKKIIVAVKHSDLASILKMPNFVPSHKYPSLFSPPLSNEMGSVFVKDIQFVFQSCDPKYLYDLRVHWMGVCNEYQDFHPISSVKKIVIINDSPDTAMLKSLYSRVVLMLLEWVLQEEDNTFPPNFSIYTGKHEGKNAVFADYIPMKKEVE